MKKFDKNAMESLVSGLTAPITEPCQDASAVTPSKESVSGSRRGRKPRGKDVEVISTVVDVDLINKARAIAGIEGLALKDIINKGLKMAIKIYEDKHGVVRPRRPKKKGDVNDVFDL